MPESGRIQHLVELDRYLEKAFQEIADEIASLAKENDPEWAFLDAFFLRVLHRQDAP